MRIILWILMGACLVRIIYLIIATIRNRINQNKETVKVRVGRNLDLAYFWLVLSVVWMIIAGWYIDDNTEKISVINSGYYDNVNRPQDQTVEEYREYMLTKPTANRNFYISIEIIWIFAVIWKFDEIIFGKYAYITKNGIYFPGRHYLPDTIRYRINESILEIYYKKRKWPIKYTIIEDREHLEDILSKSYRQS